MLLLQQNDYLTRPELYNSLRLINVPTCPNTIKNGLHGLMYMDYVGRYEPSSPPRPKRLSGYRYKITQQGNEALAMAEESRVEACKLDKLH